jgi:2-oxoglutarate ferredoxin oxidoreductase subunit beta
VNTYAWFKDKIYYLDETHDAKNREIAFKRALETDKLLLGIFYVDHTRPTFEENLGIYQDNSQPLFQRNIALDRLKNLIQQNG